MERLTLGCIALYVSDAFMLVLFLIGLATAVEHFAKRSLARLFVNCTPRQLSLAIFAQLGVLMIALLGFKFVVLQGGPGIATRHILAGHGFCHDYSVAALCTAFVLACVGLARLVRILIRKLVLVRL